MMQIRAFLYKTLFPVAAVMLVTTMAFAQAPFTEGIITYAVTLEPPANQEGIAQYTGTYTITIKGQNIRKDLTLSNGFKMAIIAEGEKMYTLRDAQGAQYAIELNPQDLEARAKKYRGFKLSAPDGVPEIAGLPATFVDVTYADGTTAELIYTTTWTLPAGADIFERLPGITNLPLSVRQRNDDGTSMYFKAVKVSQEPVANSVFKLPAGYKIISNEEYKKLTGQ